MLDRRDTLPRQRDRVGRRSTSQLGRKRNGGEFRRRCDRYDLTNVREKQEQDSFDPPSFYYTFTDYELAVEQVLYSKADLPDRIAILIETGYAPIDDKMAIAGLDDIPAFEVNERMLVFLYSLEDPEFSPGVARPVPDGFAASNYFQVLIAGQYAKLLPDGSNWKDSRHERTFTTPQLTNAIQNVGTETR